MVRFCPHDLFVNTRSDLGEFRDRNLIQFVLIQHSLWFPRNPRKENNPSIELPNDDEKVYYNTRGMRKTISSLMFICLLLFLVLEIESTVCYISCIFFVASILSKSAWFF